MCLQISKADSLERSLAELPAVGLSAFSDRIHAIRRAEKEIAEGHKKLDEALDDLAEALSDEWTFDEIWMTSLRGEARIMKRLRERFPEQ